jgi:peptide/nickel transport system permease protein
VTIPDSSAVPRVRRWPTAPPSVALFARALRLRRMQVGVACTLLVVGVALFGPFLAPHDPAELVGQPYEAPSSVALLGTDYLGHDVLSRVLSGGWSVLWMSVGATLICMALGTLVGLLAAYSGSMLDGVLMRIGDVLLGIPLLVFVLLFVAMLGPQLWLIVLLVGLGWAPQIARIARGAALQVVSLEYVEAAEVLGVPRRRILVREVLPNISAPLLVEFGLRFTYCITAIASVSFLGRGVQPPNADWGLMINENRAGLTVVVWPTLAPLVLIAIFAVGTTMIADGLSRTIARIDVNGAGA